MIFFAFLKLPPRFNEFWGIILPFLDEVFLLQFPDEASRVHHGCDSLVGLLFLLLMLRFVVLLSASEAGGIKSLSV